MSELKACPCGSNDLEYSHHSWGGYTTEVKLICSGCGITTKSYHAKRKGSGGTTYFDIEEAKERLIDAWNHRPLEASLKTEVERLRKLAKKAEQRIDTLCTADMCPECEEQYGPCISYEMKVAAEREDSDGK